MAAVPRVVLVDDSDRWRKLLRDVLQRSATVEIIGEATDGLMALERVARLDPDLVLLDIGLPNLSGIEVARTLLTAAPTRRILFVTEHPSFADVALADGVAGYVIKSEVMIDLAPAISAAMHGWRHVSARAAVDRAASPTLHSHRHEGVFCRNENTMLDVWAEEIARALAMGRSALAVAEDRRLDALGERLSRAGVDVNRATAEGRYVRVEVWGILAQFMTDTGPDAMLFERAVAPLLKGALAAATITPPSVVACGEAAPTLWRSGQRDAALRLEQLWNGLSRGQALQTVCGYLIDAEVSAEHQRVFAHINATHTMAFSAGASR